MAHRRPWQMSIPLRQFSSSGQVHAALAHENLVRSHWILAGLVRAALACAAPVVVAAPIAVQDPVGAVFAGAVFGVVGFLGVGFLGVGFVGRGHDHLDRPQNRLVVVQNRWAYRTKA
jgi:hypothetical protein